MLHIHNGYSHRSIDFCVHSGCVRVSVVFCTYMYTDTMPCQLKMNLKLGEPNDNCMPTLDKFPVVASAQLVGLFGKLGTAFSWHCMCIISVLLSLSYMTTKIGSIHALVSSAK